MLPAAYKLKYKLTSLFDSALGDEKGNYVICFTVWQPVWLDITHPVFHRSLPQHWFTFHADHFLCGIPRSETSVKHIRRRLHHVNVDFLWFRPRRDHESRQGRRLAPLVWMSKSILTSLLTPQKDNYMRSKQCGPFSVFCGNCQKPTNSHLLSINQVWLMCMQQQMGSLFGNKLLYWYCDCISGCSLWSGSRLINVALDLKDCKPGVRNLGSD